ncbi:MAG: hypothetical protein V7750_09380, partial [Sneathiella sp.]
ELVEHIDLMSADRMSASDVEQEGPFADASFLDVEQGDGGNDHSVRDARGGDGPRSVGADEESESQEDD